MQQGVSSKSAKQWQIPVALQMISGSILFLGMFSVTESVRWLLKKGREEEAWKSLIWVRADAGAAVEAEFEDIKEGLAQESNQKEGLRKMEIFMGESRGRVIQGSLSFLFQQATGGSALAYFGPQFFSQLVGSGPRDLLLTGLFGAVKLGACTFFVWFLASRVGRKKPLVFGALFMFVCMLPIAAICATISIPSDANELPVPPSATATIALVFMNVMAYNMSWGPLPWAYVPEIFPNRTRELGFSICVGAHWLFNFVLTFSTPYMINGTGQRGWGTFLFYAIFDLIMATWAAFFMMETHDKSLEHVNREIDRTAGPLTFKADTVETMGDERLSSAGPVGNETSQEALTKGAPASVRTQSPS